MGRYQLLKELVVEQAAKLMENPAVKKKQKHLRKVLRQQIKALKPKVKGAYRHARRKADHYGIDMAPLEKKLASSWQETLARLAELGYDLSAFGFTAKPQRPRPAQKKKKEEQPAPKVASAVPKPQGKAAAGRRSFEEADPYFEDEQA